MRSYVDDVPENCNNCRFKQIMSKHWDLDDYCLLNKKRIGRIAMDEDCPLEELKENI